MTLLPNGKVLAAGGYVAEVVPTNSAELFDPATGSWTLTGSMNYKRAQHVATLLANGKVLVAGGFTSGDVPTYSAELYDPASGTWTPTGPLNIALFADSNAVGRWTSSGGGRLHQQRAHQQLGTIRPHCRDLDHHRHAQRGALSSHRNLVAERQSFGGGWRGQQRRALQRGNVQSCHRVVDGHPGHAQSPL